VFRIVNTSTLLSTGFEFRIEETTMKGVWIDSLEVNLKSAFRNLKSAILAGA
jgi:hypothetical protein